MLIERMEYLDDAVSWVSHENSIFRYCSFTSALIDGKSLDAVFLACELEDLDWYWGFFGSCLFVDTTFSRCVFRGADFSNCRFLNCDFYSCQFVTDGLGAPCLFDNATWVDCSTKDCIGLPGFDT